jgi:uncharacterized membrane protein YeiH
MSITLPLLLAVVTHPATATMTASASNAASSAVASGTSPIASFITTTVPSLVASILPSGVTTTAPDAFGHGVAVAVPPAWELVAVFAGGLSGGLAAVRRKFDIAGIITLAIVTGLGGGIIRDLLLQRFGIAAFLDYRYLLTALVAATVVFFFAGTASRLTRPMAYIDAVSLGLFVVVGADKALRADLSILPAIMLGVITATGGSMLRDVLSREVPAVLQPGALYSVAAMVGSTVFVLATVWLGVLKEFAGFFAIAVAVALRFLAMWRGWQTREARDYSHHLTGLPRRLLSFLPFYRAPSEIETPEPRSDDFQQSNR